MERIRQWILDHPLRSAVIVVAGLLLGAGAFIGVQAMSAFNAIATEDFDPDAAAVALDDRDDEQLEDDIAAQLAEQEERLRQEAADREARALTDAEVQARLDALAAEWEAERNRPFEVPNTVSPPLPDEMFTSVLLIGADESGFLADTIIYVLLPSDGSSPIMASLPRDLYLTNACTGGHRRINAALGGCTGVASGPELLSLTVEDFTGIEVDHFARVDFSGFASVVDRLGGTEVCVGDRPIRDVKSGLELGPGCHVADGQTTLAWVRSRNPEFQNEDGTWVQPGGSDFDRQRKQQDILFQLADTLTSVSSVGSLSGTLTSLADVVRTDSGWTVPQMAQLGFRYRNVGPGSVTRISIPIRNYRTPAGAQVLIPAETFNETLSSVYPSAAR